MLFRVALCVPHKILLGGPESTETRAIFTGNSILPHASNSGMLPSGGLTDCLSVCLSVCGLARYGNAGYSTGRPLSSRFVSIGRVPSVTERGSGLAFYPRDAMLRAGLSDSNVSVRPSVCYSRYCIKTMHFTDTVTIGR